MRNTIITFGIICFCSLVLLQMGKVAMIKNTLPVEIVIGVFAGIFLIAGILIARRPPQDIIKKQEVTQPKEEPAEGNTVDSNKINTLGISRREYEILCEIALGLSNTEIAAKMFVSESTVKTHISNLLAKLDAKRRTEAVHKARALKIIN